MMKRRGLMGFLMTIFTLTSVAGAELPTASVIIRVVEEDGKPVANAETGVGFWVNKSGGGVDNVKVDGRTDSEGFFRAAANTIGYVSWGALKPGYYRSFGKFDFEHHEGGRWQPWGAEQTLVLRKIGNPVPMYARYMEPPRDIPELGKPIGYDLIVADWLPPHGAGEYGDLVFEATRDVRGHRDYDCSVTVRFSNPFDGIQLVREDRRRGSDFHLPRIAPEEGYQGELVLNGSSRPRVSYDSGCKEEDNYILRTRSVVEDGKLLRAMYAKIPGGICISPLWSPTIAVEMTYFLNPDYTRILEFDPQKNLFPPSVPGSQDGRVRKP